jgi:muconate cycloisomerase
MTQVRVPARPDSLNSPGVEDTDAAFAKKFKTGAKWSDFHLEPKWIVELTSQSDAVGIGETYRGAQREPLESALKALLGKDALAQDWRRLPCSDVRAYDAVESAMLDLAGRLLNVSVGQLLGGVCKSRIECSGWTGRRTPEDAARKAHEAMQRGHRVFKFKCATGDSVRDWSEQIFARCGDKIRLLLDPNQRWVDVETTLRLMKGVRPESMYALEDPIERSNMQGFKELKSRLNIPIFMHISLPYLHQGQRKEDLISALRLQCADGFNFNGPMFEFVRLAQTAALDGKTCWHGSEVDLGILEASALHACSVTDNCTIPSDIFGELVREDDLITPAIRFEKGHAIVPSGPGLGVELDRDALQKFSIGPAVELRA